MVDLKERIEVVTERMKKHRSLYEQNETAVRGQIIDPILKGLGWDTEDPEEVQPNVSAEEGIPDYSLLKGDKKVLFIEAKNLSVDIEQKEVISQLAKYCFGAGMRYGVLTNGAIWVLFRAFKEGTTMAERIVWKNDIESDNMTATIRKLNTISKENIMDIEKLIKKLQILDEIWRCLLDEPNDLVRGFIPVFGNLIKEGYPEYEFNQNEIEDFIKERVKELISPTDIIDNSDTEDSGDAQPRKMKIGDDIYAIRKSYDILVNTAEWLIRKGKLRKENCPIEGGHRWNLVNSRPEHRYADSSGDKSFKARKKLSNGLYIETKYSTIGCITNARKLLGRCGYRGDMLEVQ